MAAETLSADRILVGHCPEDGRALAVLNNRGAWPLVECPCGWRGQTTDLANRYRVDRGWEVSQGNTERRVLRPLTPGGWPAGTA